MTLLNCIKKMWPFASTKLKRVQSIRNTNCNIFPTKIMMQIYIDALMLGWSLFFSSFDDLRLINRLKYISESERTNVWVGYRLWNAFTDDNAIRISHLWIRLWFKGWCQRPRNHFIQMNCSHNCKRKICFVEFFFLLVWNSSIHFFRLEFSIEQS